jgi:two-component system, cell cycle response regulator
MAWNSMKDQQSKARVLIAEDDPVSREVLHVFLAKWGYDVSIAVEGFEALRMLEGENAPRLAVLDWMMPGMEGVQICRHIREQINRPYTYVLLLTARAEKKDLLQALELGADDYLTKPFDSKELRARLLVGQRILDLQDNLIAARETLRFQATHDLLTGLYNRGGVLDALDREHARQMREQKPFGIILADIDHFKNVNDRHGHMCGDLVLREVAQRMAGCTRPYDTVGRYGGEEFLVVVPSADALGTLELVERMRVAIEAQPAATSSGDVRVTASFGVIANDSMSPIGSNVLLQLADEALYRAKEQGRNRTELAAVTLSKVRSLG